MAAAELARGMNPPSSSLEHLLQRALPSSIGSEGPSALLSAPEAERLVEQLRVFPIEEYGSPKFLEQHDSIVQLNLQAHQNAAARTDEFVMEALVSRGKVDALIHSLLVAEVWREHVCPLLGEHLAHRVDSVVVWSLLYHEAAVANLLEVTLFHRSAAEAAGEDMLLELVDWAYRKLAYLNTEAHQRAAASLQERSAQELLAQSPQEELEERIGEAAWGAALCGLTVVRYLAEHVASLPLGVMARLVSANDTIMALLPLIDRPPWQRTTKGKELQRFVDGRWQTVAPADRLALSKLDAQAWLALYNLLLEPSCRAKYDPDEYRRGALLKLRRHLHEPLLDQLPVLKGLQRLLDEMSVGGDVAAPSNPFFSSDQGQAGASGRRGAARLILEAVPAVREGLVCGRDWAALAAQARQQWFGDSARRLAQDRAQRMLRSFEFMCSLEPGAAGCTREQGSGDRGDGGGGEGASAWPGPVQVECWRRVQNGVYERWCELKCEVDGARPPESVSVAGDGGAQASGQRHRLVPSSVEATRPLPTDGKITVRFAGRKAEAKLQLPSVAVRSHDDTPAGLWLTVGLLAADGMALQLRLKRAPKPVERDPVAGVWYAYHPVGGAVTLLVGDSATAAPACSPGPAAGHAAAKSGPRRELLLG